MAGEVNRIGEVAVFRDVDISGRYETWVYVQGEVWRELVEMVIFTIETEDFDLQSDVTSNQL